MRTVLILGMMVAMGMPVEAEPLVDPEDPLVQLVKDCIDQAVSGGSAGCDSWFCLSGGDWVQVDNPQLSKLAHIVMFLAGGVPVRIEPGPDDTMYLLPVVMESNEDCNASDPNASHCEWHLGPASQFDGNCFSTWYAQSPPR